MMRRPANRNYAFSDAFVEELARSGLRHACICPGSRSTPLVISLTQQTDVKTWVHLDERSAAYFALGMSKTLNEPVAVVSTSGTAAANFYPAVVEAHYSHIPILIITADRPPELWGWGANQTIDQSHMYGTHTKWFMNMATPEATPDLVRYVREVACRALSTAKLSPPGPVHVNFPFGEPLIPKDIPSDIPQSPPSETQNPWAGRMQNNAYTRIRNAERSVSIAKIKDLARELDPVRRGIIVCGAQHDSAFPTAISTLAKQQRFPILADPLSQVRCGDHDRKLVVDCYDAFMHSEKLIHELQPELIFRFGATPTSKVLQNYLAQHHQARQILVREGDWQDPMHTATDIFQANPNQFATDLIATAQPKSDSDWCDTWLRVNGATRKIIGKELSNIEEIFEGRIFPELATLLPPAATLFAGNSMPVRDLDTFFPSTQHKVRFLANRGASGIDGVVSTALGVSTVTPERTILVLGDLSFYHDMNGLLAAKRYNPNATIIIANNNGGGIFSFLPQREYTEIFEKYFATPHDLTFRHAAKLYSLPHSEAKSWQEFHSQVSRSLEQSGTSIVEMQTDRERNFELHKRIQAAAVKTAENVLTE